MTRLLTLSFATAFDSLFGELPNAPHPVAWFGRYVQVIERRAPRDRPRAKWVYGAGLPAAGILIAAVSALVLESVSSHRPLVIRALIAAALPEITFAWRALLATRDMGIGNTAPSSAVVAAISHLPVAYLRPGDRVLVVESISGEYAAAARTMGSEIAPYQTQPSEQFRVNLVAVAQLAQRVQRRFLFLSNPDNPTGTYFERTAVEALLAAFLV